MVTVETKERFDEKTEGMIFYAFRYCLGRATYATAECADYLVENWGRLSPSMQSTIRTKIERAFERGQYGHDIDRDEWQRVLDVAKSAG